jgi:hypothetical protein
MARPAAVAAAPGPSAEATALDRNKENSDRGPQRCSRWPRYWWLQSNDGELVQGRCKSPNLCDVCAGRTAQENIELLALDGQVSAAPEWWVVLNTPSTERRQAAYRSWWEVAKRRAGCETARLLEFTTGYGPRSGGDRRPHWNVLLKGDEAQARALLAGWQGASGATQGHVGRVDDEGGLFRYLLGHLNKHSQRPPDGWKGQRLTISKGYLWTTTPEAREAARGTLMRTWALRRAEESGLTGEAVLDAAEEELARRAAQVWSVVRRSPALA